MTDWARDALRDLSAAIAAGGIWAFDLWLLFMNSLDPESSSSAAAQTIRGIGRAFGTTGSLVVALLAAAVLGSVSLQVFRAPAVWLANLATLLVRVVEAGVAAAIATKRNQPVLRRHCREFIAVDLARRIVSHHSREIETAAGGPGADAVAASDRVYAELDQRIMFELANPQPTSAFAEFDRIAGLRLALVLPLLGLAVTAAAKYGLGYLLTVPLPFVIAFQAVDYRYQRDAELERLLWPAAVAAAGIATTVTADGMVNAGIAESVANAGDIT